MSRQVEFNRQELFEKVWETPVLKVAREIGVSDVALAKACRLAEIPLPPRGHWAKPEGKRTPRPRLPTATSADRSSVRFTVVEASAPARARVELSDRVSVPETLVDPHRLVAKTRSAAKGLKPVDGRLRLDLGGALDIGVSPAEFDRALRIFDSLIKAGAAKGIGWEIRPGGSVALCDGEAIRLRLWETLSKRSPEKPARGAPGRPQYDYSDRFEWVSTGRLSFQAEDHVANSAQRVWTGSSSTPLEDRLHEVVAGIPLIAAGVRLAREQREAWKREWDEKEARRKDAARNTEIERRLRAKLVGLVERWENANRIRAFLDSVRQSSDGDHQPTDWLEWASHQADILDPLLDLPEAVDMQVNMDGWYFNEYQRPAKDWWTDS